MKKYLTLIIVFLLCACQKKETVINTTTQTVNMNNIEIIEDVEEVNEDANIIEEENIIETENEFKKVNFDPVVKNVISTTPAKNNDHFLDDFQALSQFPDYPKGSEITSLTAALRYAKYDATIEQIYNLIEKSHNNYQLSPNKYFLGDPVNSWDFGCFSQPLINAATLFGANVINLTGSDFDNLFTYIEQGYPIIFFASSDMKPFENSSLFYYDENGVVKHWNKNHHCLVLVGFNYERDVIAVADSEKGILTEYNLTTARERYNENYKHAFIVY